MRMPTGVRKICGSWRMILGFLLPILLLPLPLMVATSESKCGYVLILMAAFFTFEPIPLAATALMPVLMFPLMGILGTEETCIQYMKGTIMMYLGGLLFAAAVEHSNLHKRIALRVLLTIGSSPRWILLGFMATTMFLSMWITNTATTAMMVPIVDAVITELEKELIEEKRLSQAEVTPRVSVISSGSIGQVGEEKNGIQVVVKSTEHLKPTSYKSDTEVVKMLSSLKLALLLSIAFAANCGGTGTLIGSGPNLVLKAQLEEMFPNYSGMTFATWMMYNVPGMLIMVFLMWVLFQILYIPCCKHPKTNSAVNVKSIFVRNYVSLGPMTFHELAVLVLFTILVILWLLRDPQFITGWGNLLNYESVKINDATPGIGMGLLLFLIPAKPYMLGNSPPLLDWKTAQNKIPWGVLILLGGGLALAEGAKVSKLSNWVSVELDALNVLSPDTIAVVLCLMTAIFTEIISNMSMATIMLPVVTQMAVAAKVNPLLFMLPVTTACSFAFMLPVGNPSNAIVFDSSDMTTMDMVKGGVLVKLLSCAVELFMLNTLGVAMFDMHTFPDWASGGNTTATTSLDWAFNATSLDPSDFNATTSFLDQSLVV